MSNKQKQDSSSDAALKSSALSAADALRKVLADQTIADSWVELGNALPNGVSAEVDGAYFDSCTCFFEALKLSNRQHAAAWLGLGASLSKTMSGQFEDGDEVSQIYCFRRAVELDSVNVSAWLHLGASLGSDQKVTIDGEEYTAAEILSKASVLKAVDQMKKKNEEEKKKAEEEKLAQQAEEEDTNQNDEDNDDDEEAKKKKRRKSSKKHALKDVDFDQLMREEAEKLRGAPEHPPSFWLQLAEALTSTDSGEKRISYEAEDENVNNTNNGETDDEILVTNTKSEIEESGDEETTTKTTKNDHPQSNSNNNKTKTHRHDPNKLFKLAGIIDVNDGQKFTRLRCYEKAVEADNRNSHLWLALEGALADEERKLLQDQEFDTVDLDVDVNQNFSSAAAEKDDSDSENNLSDEEDDDEKKPAKTTTASSNNKSAHCFIFGEKITRRDCILRAIDFEKNNSEAWLRLATEHLVLDEAMDSEMTAPNENQEIKLLDGESKVTHRIAAEKAALLAPNNSNAWVMVALCLLKAKSTSSTFFIPPDLIRSYNNNNNTKKGEMHSSSSVTTKVPLLTNSTYSALQCLERAVSLDPCNVKGWIILAKVLSILQKKDKKKTVTATILGQGKSSSLSLVANIVRMKSGSSNKNASSSTSGTNLDEVKVNEKFCLEKALSLNPTLDSIWKKLALLLAAEAAALDESKNGPNEFQKVSSTSSNSRKKIIATLRNKIPNMSSLVSRFTKDKEPVALVRGERLSLQQVLMKCVEHDSSSSDAWFTLGTFLAGNNNNNNNNHNSNSNKNQDTTTSSNNTNTIIRGFNHNRPIDAVFCFVKAVELDPFSVESWSYLGACMTKEFVDVDDEVYSRQDCFEQARVNDLRGADGWMQKGFAAKEAEKEVKNRLYEIEKQKLIVDVGNTLTHQLSRKRSLTSTVEKMNAALANSTSSSSISPRNNNIQSEDSSQTTVTSTPVTASPQKLQAQQSTSSANKKNSKKKLSTLSECLEEQIICFHRAATLDPSDGRCWANLGLVLPHGRKIKVLEDFYSNVDCLVKALEIDSTESSYWFGLGKTLRFGDRVMFVDDSKKSVKTFYDKRTSFEKAIKIDATVAEYWMHLGAQLLPSQVFELDKEASSSLTFTKQQCFEKAVSLDPKLALAWTHLALIDPDRDDRDDALPDEKFACVDGRNYSRDECYFNGLESI